MEPVVKRLLDIFETELPIIIAAINTNCAAADTTEWGMPLPLFVPNNYRFGPVFDIGEVPQMQVFSQGGSHVEYSQADIGRERQKYEVWFYFSGDTAEAANEMISRYAVAVKYLLRKYFRLQAPTNKDDELAMDGRITSWSLPFAIINDSLYKTVKFVVEYDIVPAVYEQKYGLY
jgi:hypothetical protein